MFPPTYISYDYCCVTFVSLFINLRPPRDFTLTHPEGEPCISIQMCFCTSTFVSLAAAGYFSCSRFRGTQGARPNTTAQVWALAEVRGTCSGGSKSQVTTGMHPEHVEPSRPMQTHVQVKKMPGGSCDI